MIQHWRHVCAVGALAMGSASVAGAEQTPIESLFQAAHAKLGSGAIFTAATCAEASPLLDQGLALANADPDLAVNGVIAYPLIQRANCMLVSGTEDASALAMLQRAVAIGLTPTGGPTLVSAARACLAYMTAQGRGMPADPERALGLYVMSQGASCRAVGNDAARDAADIVQRLDPSCPDVLYRFLERGTARDVLLAVELAERQCGGSSRGQDEFKLAEIGINAGGDTPEDAAARLKLNLKLGVWHKAQYRYAIALGYILAADPKSAEAPLGELIRGNVPYRLILENGRPWAAPDGK